MSKHSFRRKRLPISGLRIWIEGCPRLKEQSPRTGCSPLNQKKLKYLSLANVTKGWRTSIIGAVMIIAAIASVFVKEATWVDATVAISIGIGLLFAPDDAIKKANQ
jgi:hypothetical protein